MTFVSRAEWGSATTTRTQVLDALPELYIHHTGAGAVPLTVDAEMRMMRDLQAYAIRPKAQGGKGYNDLDYNVIVGGTSGNIYEARGLGYGSAATLDRNKVSRSICVMGNYESAIPTVAALAGIVEAGRMMIDQRRVTVDVIVRGHRDNPAHPLATACPGHNLYVHVADLAAAIVATTPSPPGGDEMSTARIYRDRRYWNTWLIGAGTPVHLTPTLLDSYQAAGIPMIVDVHDQLLKSLLFQCGLTDADLVSSGG